MVNRHDAILFVLLYGDCIIFVQWTGKPVVWKFLAGIGAGEFQMRFIFCANHDFALLYPYKNVF